MPNKYTTISGDADSTTHQELSGVEMGESVDTTAPSVATLTAGVRRRSSVTIPPSANSSKTHDHQTLSSTSAYEQVPKLRLSDPDLLEDDNDDFLEEEIISMSVGRRRVSFEAMGNELYHRRSTSSSGAAAAAAMVSGAEVSFSWRDYCQVLVRYPMFRAYLLSHICQHVGDWFVRIACLLIVQELSGKKEGTALAHLVLSVLLPKTIFAQVGGVLADRFDRRRLMIIMDLLSGVVVLGYIAAVRQRSLPLVYAVSMVRSMIGSAYYPVTTGIVPLLVPNVRDLQFAVTMNSWAWSIMAIVGGSLAGSITSAIGLQACYVVDFVTFLGSAAFVYFGIQGNYSVTDPNTTRTADLVSIQEGEGMGFASRSTVVLAKACDSFKQLVVYLSTCGFGLLVAMKASASLVWGAEDIVGVKFSAVEDADGTIDDKASSIRTGILFSFVGIGSLLGPTLMNLVTDANKPRTLQRACWIGIIILTTGWLFISQTNTFGWFLVGTLIRTCGGGTVYVNSTLILQALSDKHYLGRVLAVEYTLYTLMEAISATASGGLLDAGLSKEGIALCAGMLGTLVATFWGIYYFNGYGAAQPRFNELRPPVKDETDISSLEIEMPSKDMAVEMERAVTVRV